MKNYLLIVLCLLFVKIGVSQQDMCLLIDESEKGSSQSTKVLLGCDQIELTFEEILALPNAKYRFAFHFEADENGNNFTCDPADPLIDPDLGGNPLLYAPLLVEKIMEKMNDYGDIGLLTNESIDTKFEYTLSSQNDGCGPGIFFYDHGGAKTDIPDAIDIYFINVNTSISGAAPRPGGWMYIYNQLEGHLNWYNNFWDVASLILHEFGHTRSLHHAFYCQNPCSTSDVNPTDLINPDQEAWSGCSDTVNPDSGDDTWNASPRDLAMSYGHPEIYFTKCEFLLMWNYMLNNPRPYFDLDMCEETLSPTELVYDVNEYLIWDSKKVFNKDVVVKSGTTIEVQCDVEMGEDKRIIVESGAKLFVNGGRITNLCSDPWQGIRVHGGNLDYDVKLTNAIIENTSSEAVKMLVSSSSSGFGNGILQADNTDFNNVRRLAHFGVAQPSNNPSYVKDCVQNGGKWGITNWQCIGISILGNTFNDIDAECVVISGGQATINGNTFYSGNSDVLMSNVSEGFGSEISENIFNGSNTGFKSLGSTFGQHKIFLNQFAAGELDIFMDGVNNYEIYNNDLTARIGGYFVNNGIHSNDVHNNLISGNEIGLMPSGENSSYQFYQNCFNTSRVDNYIFGQISILQSSPKIGPSNNCFTHGGDANHPTYDMIGDPEPFIYYEPNDKIDNCFDAVKADADISILKVGKGIDPCGEAGAGIRLPSSYSPCNPPGDIESIETALDWLNHKLQQISNDPNLATDEKTHLIDFYKRCMLRVQGMKKELLLERGKYQEVRQLIRHTPFNDAVVSTFSSYIHENNLVEAERFLSRIKITDEKLLDFVAIQDVNLKLIKAGGEYIASGSELAMVEDIARKRHPYAGYAKALYYSLTGEIISTKLPNLNRVDRDRGGAQEKVQNINATTSIFPNPFSEKLHVNVTNLETGTLEITDVLGVVKHNEDISGSQEINTSDWNNGLYIVTVFANDEIIHQEKVMLLH